VSGPTVKVWDVDTGRERASFRREMHTHWCDVWFTPNGLVLVSCHQALVKLWDVP
jgi:WD40 repeat protein